MAMASYRYSVDCIGAPWILVPKSKIYIAVLKETRTMFLLSMNVLSPLQDHSINLLRMGISYLHTLVQP